MESWVHCRGARAAASKPGARSPLKTRNLRRDRTAVLGSLRPPPCLLAASCCTKSEICWACKEDQSRCPVPKQAARKRLAIRRYRSSENELEIQGWLS